MRPKWVTSIVCSMNYKYYYGTKFWHDLSIYRWMDGRMDRWPMLEIPGKRIDLFIGQTNGHAAAATKYSRMVAGSHPMKRRDEMDGEEVSL